jgi:hypothetical protein
MIEKIRAKLTSWIAEEALTRPAPLGLRLKAKFGRFILFKSRR